MTDFALDYKTAQFQNALLVHADCFDWLRRIPDCSIDAVVTDPPYGVKEYEVKEIEKMLNGGAGIWRIPPSFDGNVRAPLPRFTALEKDERDTLVMFFRDWARALVPKLKPGAHVFVASNSFLSQLVFSSIIDGGLEFRTEIVRVVQTLRGGDRPKLGEKDFPDVCSLPRGCYEPWGLFRKAIPKGMTVRQCLATYGTGGLRRRADGNPFMDVIFSERTPRRERDIAEHPSLKPQSLMRQLVYAALPLGKGVVVDTFMGAGTTLAAAEAVGYQSVGIERYENYFKQANSSVALLSTIQANGWKHPGEQVTLQLDASL
jgi:site-specific DNA-methyltransferase (adenine-specific)